MPSHIAYKVLPNLGNLGLYGRFPIPLLPVCRRYLGFVVLERDQLLLQFCLFGRVGRLIRPEFSRGDSCDSGRNSTRAILPSTRGTVQLFSSCKTVDNFSCFDSLKLVVAQVCQANSRLVYHFG